jgi:hypothetical protein
MTHDDTDMTTRNQLVEMMVDAYCRRYHDSDDPVRDGMEDVLDTIEPIIRASEQGVSRLIELYRAMVIEAEAEACERLRAQVDALPKAKVAGVLYAVDDVVSRVDVLAMFGGESDG